MSIIAIALKHLIAAGATGNTLIAAVEEMEIAIELLKNTQAIDEQANRRRESDRNRKALKKAIPQNSAESAEFPIPPCFPLNGFPDPSFLPPIIPPTPVDPLESQKRDLGISNQTWKDFSDMRLKIRKPMTERAKELVLIELVRLRKQGHDPTAVLEQSVRKSWQDVFDIKEKSSGNANEKHQRKPTAITIGKRPDSASLA